jgi:ABC-type uncharacterized transport system auxiliary subunit
MTRGVALLLSILPLTTLGCALTSKSDPTLLRYYSLDAPRHRERAANPPPTGDAPARLRVGRINAALYIRDRMAFRESDVAIGYYEDFRWTERPESYVRRDLARALFEDEGVEEIIGGGGLTLDVDLDSFEEVREKHAAVVRLSWQLRDDTVVLLRRTVTVQHPLEGDAKDTSSHAALAIALSEALEDAIDQTVRVVVPNLSTAKGTAPGDTLPRNLRIPGIASQAPIPASATPQPARLLH